MFFWQIFPSRRIRHDEFLKSCFPLRVFLLSLYNHICEKDFAQPFNEIDGTSSLSDDIFSAFKEIFFLALAILVREILAVETGMSGNRAKLQGKYIM